MGASLLIFLNKTDVEGCMTEDEARQVRPGEERERFLNLLIMIHQRLRLDTIKTHRWTILPCSAMTGRNLHEGLEWVIQDAKDRLFLY